MVVEISQILPSIYPFCVWKALGSLLSASAQPAQPPNAYYQQQHSQLHPSQSSLATVSSWFLRFLRFSCHFLSWSCFLRITGIRIPLPSGICQFPLNLAVYSIGSLAVYSIGRMPGVLVLYKFPGFYHIFRANLELKLNYWCWSCSFLVLLPFLMAIIVIGVYSSVLVLAMIVILSKFLL